MKANELMIGDWVNSTIEGIGRVTRIDLDGFIAITYGKQHNAVVCNSYDLIPIPLTIEILEKNGFKFNDGMFDWFRGDEDSYYTGFESVHIDVRSGFMSVLKETKEGKQKQVRCDCSGCVHELQHALKLCGIEKQIEL